MTKPKNSIAVFVYTRNTHTCPPMMGIYIYMYGLCDLIEDSLKLLVNTYGVMVCTYWVLGFSVIRWFGGFGGDFSSREVFMGAKCGNYKYSNFKYMFFLLTDIYHGVMCACEIAWVHTLGSISKICALRVFIDMFCL